jgi:hypothetical protein
LEDGIGPSGNARADAVFDSGAMAAALVRFEAQDRHQFSPRGIRHRVQRIAGRRVTEQTDVVVAGSSLVFARAGEPGPVRLRVPSSRWCSWAMPAAAKERPRTVLLSPGLREIG